MSPPLEWLQSKLRQHDAPIVLDDNTQSNRHSLPNSRTSSSYQKSESSIDHQLTPPKDALPYLSLLSLIEPSIPPTLSKYLSASLQSHQKWDDEDRRDSFWLLGRWVRRDFNVLVLPRDGPNEQQASIKQIDLLIHGDEQEHDKLIQLIKEKYHTIMKEEEELRRMRERVRERNETRSAPSIHNQRVKKSEAKSGTHDVELQSKTFVEPNVSRAPQPSSHEKPSADFQPHKSTIGRPDKLNISQMSESTDFVNVSMSVDDLRKVQDDWQRSTNTPQGRNSIGHSHHLPVASQSPSSSPTPAITPKKRASSFVQSQHIADMRQTVQIGEPPHVMEKINPKESLSLTRESMRSLKQSLSGSSSKSLSTIESLSRSMGADGYARELSLGSSSSDDDSEAHKLRNRSTSNSLSASIHSATSIPDESPNVRASTSSQRTIEDTPDDHARSESSEDSGNFELNSSAQDIAPSPLKFSSPVLPSTSQTRHSNRYTEHSSMDSMVNQSTLYDRYLNNNNKNQESRSASHSNAASIQYPTAVRQSRVERSAQDDSLRSLTSPKGSNSKSSIATPQTDRSFQETVRTNQIVDDSSDDSEEHITRASMKKSMGRSQQLSPQQSPKKDTRSSVRKSTRPSMLPSDDESSNSDSGEDEDEITALQHSTRESNASFAGSITQSLDLMDEDMQSARSISFEKRATMGRLAHTSESPLQRSTNSLGETPLQASADVKNRLSTSTTIADQVPTIPSKNQAADSSTHTSETGSVNSLLDQSMERPRTPETYEELSMLKDEPPVGNRPQSASNLFQRRQPLFHISDELTTQEVLERDVGENTTIGGPQKRRSFSDLDLLKRDADFSDMNKFAPPKTASGSMEQLQRENSKLRFMLFDFKKKVKQERRYLQEKIKMEKQQLHERILKTYKIDPQMRQSSEEREEDTNLPSKNNHRTNKSLSRSRNTRKSHQKAKSPIMRSGDGSSPSNRSISSQSVSPSASPSNAARNSSFSRPLLAKSNSYAEIHSPKNRQLKASLLSTSVNKSSVTNKSTAKSSLRESRSPPRARASVTSQSHEHSGSDNETFDEDVASRDDENSQSLNESADSTQSDQDLHNASDDDASGSEEQPVSSYLAMFRKNKHSQSSSQQSTTNRSSKSPKNTHQSEDKLFITELSKSKLPTVAEIPRHTVFEIPPENLRQSQEQRSKQERMRKFEKLRNRKLRQRRRDSNAEHKDDVEQQVNVEDSENDDELTPNNDKHAPDKHPVQDKEVPQSSAVSDRTGISPGRGLLAHPPPVQRVQSKANMTRSNKLLIQNAIRHVCLAGFVNEDEQQEVLKFLKACHYKHFLILVREAKAPAFRGLYAFTDDDQVPEKIYGRGPKHLKPEYVKFFFRYDSARKKFCEISHAKSFSGTTDGVCLNEEYKRKMRKKVPVI